VTTNRHWARSWARAAASRCLLLAGAISSMALGGAVQNVAAAADGVQERARAVLAGMRDQRERLRQGLVRGSGHMFRPYRSGTVDGPISFMYAFDFDSDLLHVERDDPRGTVAGVRSPENLKRVDVRDVPLVMWHYARIQKPDCAIIVVNHSEGDNPAQVQIYKPDFNTRRNGVIDIRAVGLLGTGSYEKQVSWEDTFRYLNESIADELVDEGEGLSRIRMPTKDGLGRNTLWIDRKRGFSPVRLEFQHKAVNPVRGHPETLPEPYMKCEATWTEINGVWVPLTYRIEDQQQHDAEGRSLTYSHAYHWEIVNQPVPMELFEIESLHAPKGSLVTDHRGQDVVLTRVIGEPDNPETGTVYTKPTEGEPSRVVPRGYRRGTWLFLGFNVVAVLLIALLLYFRRSKKAGP
jgi:hypothetical protein